MGSEVLLSVSGVTFGYGETPVFEDLSLEIAHGEFVAVVGPSGCGKTTLLNLLSGYVEPLRGTVSRHGRVRMVYQQGGLFPWKTTAQNLEMGVRDIKEKNERGRRVDEMLRITGLERFGNHYPYQLSGGMRQRVELGRSLIGQTDILLMDEPFSALDYLTRLRMRLELSRILALKPCTVVLVTHDIEEAAQLADRVFVLSERPATVRRVLEIDLARPRELTHSRVVEAVHGIMTALEMDDSGRSLTEIEQGGIGLLAEDFAVSAGSKERQ